VGTDNSAGAPAAGLCTSAQLPRVPPFTNFSALTLGPAPAPAPAAPPIGLAMLPLQAGAPDVAPGARRLLAATPKALSVTPQRGPLGPAASPPQDAQSPAQTLQAFSVPDGAVLPLEAGTLATASGTVPLGTGGPLGRVAPVPGSMPAPQAGVLMAGSLPPAPAPGPSTGLSSEGPGTLPFAGPVSGPAQGPAAEPMVEVDDGMFPFFRPFWPVLLLQANSPCILYRIVLCTALHEFVSLAGRMGSLPRPHFVLLPNDSTASSEKSNGKKFRA
jgi:hypothetical protein